jgi:hypothetical protein
MRQPRQGNRRSANVPRQAQTRGARFAPGATARQGGIVKRFVPALLLRLSVLIVGVIALPASAAADPVPLVANAVIIDNAPFFNFGPEDSLGTGNYALNHRSFMDIPYAIFDLRSVGTIGSATLTWDFAELFGDSPPALITLYGGSDSDGTISPMDRLVGSTIDTFLYSGGQPRSHDVTPFVQLAASSGFYFAVRLEAAIPPAGVSEYYGGQFRVPSLSINDPTVVPEPASLALVAAGLGMTLARRRRAKRATAR